MCISVIKVLRTLPSLLSLSLPLTRLQIVYRAPAMSTPPPSHLSAPVSPPPPHQSQRKRKDINRPGSDNDSSTDSSSERSSKKACISGSLDVEIQLLLRDVKRYVRTDQPFLKFSEIFQTVLHYGPLSAELDEDETLEFDSERCVS